MAWEDEEDDIVQVQKSKWADEEDDENVADTWELDSSDEEKKHHETPASQAKKHSTLKQKIAERERLKKEQSEDAARRQQEAEEAEEEEDPIARKERLRKLELEADLQNINDLFGGAAVTPRDIAAASAAASGKSSPRPVQVPDAPTSEVDSKEDFDNLLSTLAPSIASNAGKAHYAGFLNDFIRALASPLSSEQIRKAASALTTLSNEKQREEKAAAGGKGKRKGKPALAGGAQIARGRTADTTVYDEALDDEFDGFM